jgi:hypothetical protein
MITPTNPDEPQSLVIPGNLGPKLVADFYSASHAVRAYLDRKPTRKKNNDIISKFKESVKGLFSSWRLPP